MAHRSILTLAVSPLLVILALFAFLAPFDAAVGETTGAGAGKDAAAAEPPAIDPDAVEALVAMSTDLRKLSSFSLHADTTSELVLEDGQKLQFQGALDVKLRRPDRFVVTMKSEQKSRDVFYDGKAVTIYAPQKGFYASFAAPATIAATIDKARDDFAVEIPLADLFTFDKDDRIIKSAKSGFVVGDEVINGTPCVHYAFRQAHVDWQIWIASEGPAYPAKIVITTTDDPSMPQYVAYLAWKPDTKISSSDFTFKPGAKDVNISIVNLAAAAPAKQ